MLAFILSPLGRAVSGFVLVGVVLAGTHWKAYQAGAAGERAASLQRSIEVLRERKQTDAEISKMDDGQLCRALGGRVSGDGACE